jgi:hypothetical protein
MSRAFTTDLNYGSASDEKPLKSQRRLGQHDTALWRQRQEHTTDKLSTGVLAGTLHSTGVLAGTLHSTGALAGSSMRVLSS